MEVFDEDDLVELGLLRGLEIDKLVEFGFISPENRFDEAVLDTIILSFPEIRLEVTTGERYPAEQLRFSIENISLPRLIFDSLRTELRIILSEDAASNNFESWKNREDGGVFEFEMTGLHLAMKILEHLSNFRESLESQTPSVDAETDLRNVAYKNALLPSDGFDFSRINPNPSAVSILGKTAEQICEQIPQGFRVLHVESVVRSDAYANFLECQESIATRLRNLTTGELMHSLPFNHRLDLNRNGKEAIVQYLIAPKITFHGTPNHRVPSIVRYGFLRPGDVDPETGHSLSVRCGSTYGRGIYTSPSAEFSLVYSGDEATPTTPNGFWGLKLIVCATIMGRARSMFRDDDWRSMDKPYPGSDSHVANSEHEYVCFNTAQVLPVWVVHLDWGEDNRLYFKDTPSDPQNWVPQKTHPRLAQRTLAPGDKQRQKEALLAKASKFFPYGYGPATGTSFVVEDVGEVEEDEEDYGDYQKFRLLELEGAKEEKSVWEWDLSEKPGWSKNDEYTQALLAKRPRDKKSSFEEDD